MPTSFPKSLAGKSRQDLITFFAEEDFRDSVGHPLHMRAEFMELVDMALSGTTRVAAIQEDLHTIREMLEKQEAQSQEGVASFRNLVLSACAEAARDNPAFGDRLCQRLRQLSREDLGEPGL